MTVDGTKKFTAVVIVCMLVPLVLLAVLFVRSEVRAKEVREQVLTAEEEIDRNRETIEEANDRLERAGEPTVKVPSPAATSTGPSGDKTIYVDGEPSMREVEAAVSTYCAGGKCDGTDGRNGSPGKNGKPGEDATGVPGQPGQDGAPGTDGRSPSAGDVASAVSQYCTSDGSCRGDRGPGPSEEQVAAAVVAFCGESRCSGPAGKDGKDGTDGKDGRGVASVRCADGRWLVTYTDDTVADVGSCAPEPAPTVTVTSEPTGEPNG